MPLGQLAQIRYTPGPQNIRSEHTFLTGYVIFNNKKGTAEVDVVEDAGYFNNSDDNLNLAIGDRIDAFTWSATPFAAGSTISEAKQFAHMVADCDVFWFEEPVTADDKSGMAEVRAATSIPIATGESEATRYAFRELARLRAADIFQPDPAFCGGISEAMRIGTLASAFNLRFAPHLWAGAPCFFAGLHVCAASPASFTIEYSLGANPMIHELSSDKISVTDGMIAIPEKPGLGLEMNETALRKYCIT